MKRKIVRHVKTGPKTGTHAAIRKEYKEYK